MKLTDRLVADSRAVALNHTAGLIILLKLLAGLFGIDLKESARDVKKDMGRTGEEESIENFHWNNLVYPRAYSAEKDEVVEKKVGKIESSVFPERVSIDKVQRNGEVIEEVKPDQKVKKGDTLLLLGTESH